MIPPQATFILSMERSGSSLLRVLLNEHPQIAALPETHFLPTIHRILKKNNTKRTGNEIRLLLQKNTWFQQLNLPEENRKKVWRILEQPPINESVLFETIFRGYAEKYHKPIWIEKTPLYSLYWRDILEIFPEAHFIIITREPFGYCHSMKRAKWFKIPPPLHFIIYRYQKYFHSLNTLMKQYNSDLFIQITFKELITNVESALSKVFNFLQVESVPFKQLSGYRDNPNKHYSKEHLAIGHHDRLFQPINPTVVNEWETGLKNWEKAAINREINRIKDPISPTDYLRSTLDCFYSNLVWNTTGEKILRKRF